MQSRIAALSIDEARGVCDKWSADHGIALPLALHVQIGDYGPLAAWWADIYRADAVLSHNTRVRVAFWVALHGEFGDMIFSHPRYADFSRDCREYAEDQP